MEVTVSAPGPIHICQIGRIFGNNLANFPWRTYANRKPHTAYIVNSPGCNLSVSPILGEIMTPLGFKGPLRGPFYFVSPFQTAPGHGRSPGDAARPVENLPCRTPLQVHKVAPCARIALVRPISYPTPRPLRPQMSHFGTFLFQLKYTSGAIIPPLAGGTDRPPIGLPMPCRVCLGLLWP